MTSVFDPAPVFVIGFMATGKSTVGRLVARHFGRRFVDLDERIAEAAGKPVADIFWERGEAGFRRLEAETLGRVLGEPNLVVAVGGGTPCFGDNLEHMAESGVVVALRASMEEIVRRAMVDGGARTRPLLGGAEGARASAERLFRERQAAYEAADVVVTTDQRTPEQVADEVQRRVSLRLGQVSVRLGRRSYPILLRSIATTGEVVSEILDTVTTCAVVTDENVAQAGHAGSVCAALESQGIRPVMVTVPGGERSKTLAEAERVASACVAAGLDRHSALLAVGGGVVGDLAGFVAAVLYRGVPLVQVPTTLLAMVDSSIGGKTGLDLPAGKNLVGAFFQPRFVLADLGTLASLPARQLRAAWGEVLKMALAFDPGLFARLEHGPKVELDEVVVRCAQAKARIVAEDERETTGSRAVLNLGHTVGHAIEAASLTQAEPLLHGEAVALGLVAAARVSARLGLCDSALEAAVCTAGKALGLPITLDPWLRPEVLGFMGVDKKRAGGRVGFIALEAVGRTRRIELAPSELGRLLQAQQAGGRDERAE